MRNIAIMMVGCALAGAGCNSKESSEPAAEAAPAPGKSTAGRPDFNSRSSSPGSSVVDGAATESSTRSGTQKSAFKELAQKAATIEQPVIPVARVVEVPAVAADDATPVRPEDLPQEGDEILVPPQMLGLILPGLNFEGVTRTEPINIKSLLESQNLVITNYQQLALMGLTNYQIVRAQIPAKQAPVP